MRPLFACFALLLGFTLFAEAAPQPAGYVIAFELQGEDLAKGTAVVRAGKELAPRIYMPLFDGDAVFVRDAASRVIVDVADGGRKDILRWITHGPEGDIIDLYTTLPWHTLKAALVSDGVASIVSTEDGAEASPKEEPKTC